MIVFEENSGKPVKLGIKLQDEDNMVKDDKESMNSNISSLKGTGPGIFESKSNIQLA